MSNTVYRARHREQRNALAPLAALAASATSNVAQVSRRSAVVAISSGLVVGLASAGPAAADTQTDAAGAKSVDATALGSGVETLLNAAPTVTIAADAGWTKESSKIKVTPAPEPEIVRETPRAASRTAERTAISSDTVTATSSTASTTTATKSTKSSVPQSVNGNAVLEIASRYVGVPYVSGGTTPNGFDCSGFTSYVYAQLGISLPRTSGAQKAAGTIVPRSEARAGDLIWTPGHISIYAGGGKQIDAPRPGKTIQFRSIWQSNPTFIRLG
ncbi:C40 family peptidase [Timonella sp. A28]|uniref:C40 family peptidase n=1 Tax=Timonella sp. A28 TaxID=3442640 RepID=UPI003EBE7C90